MSCTRRKALSTVRLSRLRPCHRSRQDMNYRYPMRDSYHVSSTYLPVCILYRRLHPSQIDHYSMSSSIGLCRICRPSFMLDGSTYDQHHSNQNHTLPALFLAENYDNNNSIYNENHWHWRCKSKLFFTQLKMDHVPMPLSTLLDDANKSWRSKPFRNIIRPLEQCQAHLKTVTVIQDWVGKH